MNLAAQFTNNHLISGKIVGKYASFITEILKRKLRISFSVTKTYKKRMRNSISKTVKIQILRIRFLRQSESIFFVYNEKARGCNWIFLRGKY
jgi:hypothetical protein